MLEFLRPENDGADALTAAMFLSGRTALSSSLTLVGQVPFARHSTQGIFYDYYLGLAPYDIDEATIGNLYLGIEGTPKSGRIFGEGGVRIPLASDSKPFAASTGIVADVRRSQAFFANTLCVESAANFVSNPQAEFGYRLRISPVLEYDVDATSSRLATNYSGQIGYLRPEVRVGAAFSGRVDVTNVYRSLSSRTQNQIELHADFLRGSVRPGVDVKVPVGDWRSGVGSVLGVSLTWTR